MRHGGPVQLEWTWTGRGQPVIGAGPVRPGSASGRRERVWKVPESTARHPMHDAVRSAIRLDASLVAPVAGAVTAVPVTVLFALGLAVSALVGSACAGVGWLHISTLVVWCFVGGLVVALGPARSVVGIQGVMAIIIFGRAPHSVGASVALAVAVLVGGAVQTAVQLVVRVPFGLRPQRRATALVYRQLAELAGGRKDSSPAAARTFRHCGAWSTRPVACDSS